MDTAQDGISAVYDWQNARRAAVSHKGKQALSIRRVQRKKRGQNCEFEPELYICKEYSLAGVNSTKANGPRYVFGEYRMLKDLTHPNIVDYVDFSYDPDSQVAKMYTQYCEFGDLEQTLQSRDGKGKLNTREAAHVMYQIASALLYLHHGVHHTDNTLKLAQLPSLAREGKARNGWVPLLHRDIKPANVFVAELTDIHIRVKLGDFGIAKIVTEGTDTYVGSPAYHAPEQRMEFKGPGKRRTTIKSDIYALGVTMQQVMDISTEDDTRSAELGATLQQFVQNCLISKDSDRPSSGSIIDGLRPHIDYSEAPTMTSEVLKKLITVPTKRRGKSGKKHGGRLEFDDYARLYRRCLQSGSIPSREASECFDSHAKDKVFKTWKKNMIQQISISLHRPQYGPSPEAERSLEGGKSPVNERSSEAGDSPENDEDSYEIVEWPKAIGAESISPRVRPSLRERIGQRWSKTTGKLDTPNTHRKTVTRYDKLQDIKAP